MRIIDNVKRAQSDVVDGAHRIVQAGLGTVIAAEDRGTAMFNSLVERGRDVEAARREVLAKNSREIRSRIDTVTERANRIFDRQVSSLLHRVGVPTRREILALTDRVEQLTRNVDTLQQEIPAAGTTDETTYHVTPHDSGWQIAGEGAARATSVHATKQEAVDAARALAKSQTPCRLVVHKMDGTVQAHFTYGLE